MLCKIFNKNYSLFTRLYDRCVFMKDLFDKKLKSNQRYILLHMYVVALKDAEIYDIYVQQGVFLFFESILII